MKAARLFLAIALAAGSTAALAAGGSADSPTWSTPAATQGDMPRTGRSFAVQNERQKQRLEAQGFPQYDG